MPSQKPDEFEAAVRAGKIGRLYAFDGPELWLKERALAALTEKLITPDTRDFNFERYDGNDASGGAIVTAAQNLPFLGDRRLVIVNSADELAAADARLVAEALPNVPSSTCLVFVFDGKANLRDEIPAQVSSLGVIVTFWPPFPNQMPTWTMNEAKRHGKTLSFDAASLLVEACESLSQISGELEKLALFVGSKATIDAKDLQRHGLPDQTGDYKDLEQAVWVRDHSEALRQGRLLTESGLRSEALLPVLERIFRSLLLAFTLRAKGADWNAVFAELGMRGKTQQANLQQGSRAYTVAEIRRAFSIIVNADVDVKTGRLPSEMAVTLALNSICGKKENAPAPLTATRWARA